MALRIEGFHEDTVNEFIQNVYQKIPWLGTQHLQQLIDYMKSVGATSEAKLDRLKEKDLRERFGTEEAKLIMQYCKAKMEQSARPKSTECNGVNGGKKQSEEEPKEACTSSTSDVPVPEVDKSLEVVDKIVGAIKEMQKCEGEKNREMIMMLSKSVEAANQTMNNTIAIMSSMMEQQLRLQREVLRDSREQYVAMKKQQKEFHSALEEKMEQMQIMNRQSLEALSERIDAALGAKGKTKDAAAKETEKNSKGCVIL